MGEEKKIQEYKNDKITVRFNPDICEHSGNCTSGLRAVFNIKSRPWVDVNAATPEAIMEQIKRCPSGALSYELPGQDVLVEAASDQPVEITVKPNGSLRIAGKVLIKDMEGNLIMETSKCSLCRCGASENKPFCDGSHRKIGFVG